MQSSSLSLYLSIGSGLYGCVEQLEYGSGQFWFCVAVIFFVVACLFDTAERSTVK